MFELFKGARSGAESGEISRVNLADMGRVDAMPDDAASVDAACDWVRAHEALSRLARQRAAADAEEGRWLLCAWRASAHAHLGYASFSEYIERLFGYKPRSTQEKLRVAEALESLPNMGRLLNTGALGWCAVRELTRVATPDTEQAWLSAASGKTTRQLEALVAGKGPGDDPAAPSSNDRRHVLRFEVAPETFALFREALLHLRRAMGGRIDDDTALMSMARQMLGGPADDGRSSYQISLTVCAACGRGEQVAGGELVPVGDEVVAMARCDAQHLGHLLPHPANQNASTEPDTRNETEHIASHELGETSRADAHAGAVGTAAPTRVDAPAAQPAPSRPRVQQDIPPALRRAILARDHHRCVVPGCTHAIFVDIHHLRPRSEGGRNEPANLLTLCSAHHRAAHRGELVIEPGAEGARYRHADGSAYGQNLTPRAVDAHSKVFSALRQLGFREREVRVVMAELRRDDALRQASAECLLRAALQSIRSGRDPGR